MKRLIIKPAARLDLVNLADFIAADNLSAATRFLAQARATIETLARFPHLGRPLAATHREIMGIRVCCVQRFRAYLVLYRVDHESIVIVRVVHGAQSLEELLRE